MSENQEIDYKGLGLRLLGMSDKRRYFKKIGRSLHLPDAVEAELENVIFQYLNREEIISAGLPLHNRLKLVYFTSHSAVEACEFIACRTGLKFTYVPDGYYESAVDESVPNNVAVQAIISVLKETPGVYFFDVDTETIFIDDLLQELDRHSFPESIIVFGDIPISHGIVNHHYDEITFGPCLLADNVFEYHRKIVQSIMPLEVSKDKVDDNGEPVLLWNDELLNEIAARSIEMAPWDTEALCHEILRRWILKNKQTPSMKLIDNVIPSSYYSTERKRKLQEAAQQSTPDTDNGEETQKCCGGCECSECGHCCSSEGCLGDSAGA